MLLHFYIAMMGFLFVVAPLCAGTEEDEEKSKVAVDETQYVTARSAGMAGAISTLADGVEAPLFNPAGIGGYGKKPSRHFVRQLDFPYVGAAANESTMKVYNAYEKDGANSDAAATRAILEANNGKRQYARASIFPNIVMGRTMVGPVMDQQFAAVPQDDDSVTMHYRSLSGVVGGASACDPKGHLCLGTAAFYLSRSDAEGNLDFNKVVDVTERKKALKDVTTESSGTAINSGLMWQISDHGSPRLAVVARDVGNTQFKSKTDGKPDIQVDQDLTVGFSVSPQIGKSGAFNYVVEGTRLSNNKVAMNKKFRTSAEYLLGIDDYGPSIFGIRAGYNLAGVSAGAHLDFGLIGISVASQAEDVGIGNVHVVDRRTVAVIHVNVAE